ncbi:MAG TPA: VTT domain-containing protein [Ktedonobacteraceae bacterium]
MNSFFITALQQYGYPALWVIVCIAAAGAPVSGNLLLYAAGAFAAFDEFNIYVLFFVGFSAAVAGDGLAYWLGRKFGAPLLAWLARKQRWRFISFAALERSRTYFRRRAAWAIFISRFFIVVLGGPINWLAGAERYPYRRFLIWDASGQFLGALIPLGVGYIFATSWSEAESILGAFSSFALAFLATLIISIALVRRMRAHKRSAVIKARVLLAQTEVQSELAAQQPAESDDTSAPAKIARPTILILISHSGGGHLNLAQALKEMLGSAYDVLIMDPQSPFIERSYTLLSRRFMPFLTWQFTLTDNKIAAWLLQNCLAFVDRQHVSQLIEEVQPRLIITTHALVSYAAARANEQLRQRVPLVFQFTDLGRLHMSWFVEKHADAYLAPTREIFAQAARQGIARECLYLTGRPVRGQFSRDLAASRAETLSNLGLDPACLTIFLQGGAKGSAGVAQTLEGMLAVNVPLQIILAAGDNAELAGRYANLERVSVLPFTAELAPFMAAADVIAGKAGASFITEAFMLEKPFLATSLIAGQETPSLRFIEQHELGWVCLQTTAQQELLAKLASNSELLAEKVSSIRAYKAWNVEANQAIQPLIERLLS